MLGRYAKRDRQLALNAYGKWAAMLATNKTVTTLYVETA
jgi:hypothetical protein